MCESRFSRLAQCHDKNSLKDVICTMLGKRFATLYSEESITYRRWFVKEVALIHVRMWTGKSVL